MITLTVSNYLGVVHLILEVDLLHLEEGPPRQQGIRASLVLRSYPFHLPNQNN